MGQNIFVGILCAVSFIITILCFLSENGYHFGKHEQKKREENMEEDMDETNHQSETTKHNS